jgi:sigma-B regulation protein RsbU (phosphoserine phosphatase)
MTRRIAVLTGENPVFEMSDEYKSGDEIEVLAKSFADLSNRTREYMEENLRITAEKERIGAELNVATRIQADMLPQIFPAFPERKDFDLYASMDPAKEVGGDFYDFFLIDEDHLAMVLADVSGKGVPAALFMVVAKTLIKNRAKMGGSPAEILSDVNRELSESNTSGLFVTVWMAILQLSTGKGMAANAGHEHPALRHKDGDFVLVEYKHSPPLGLLEEVPVFEHVFQLEKGDVLFVYTDGVTEATQKGKKMFGVQRMLAALNQKRGAAPKEVLEHMTEQIVGFVGEADQFDDITMLSFAYYGTQE